MKPTTTNSKVALDTNVIIYRHDDDEHKRLIADKLLSLRPVVSGQTVPEYLNVMQRQFHLPKSLLVDMCLIWMRICTIFPVTAITLEKAKHIVKRYKLQIFDSIIIASALEANCSVIYTEDMQHGMTIDGALTIVNPFV